MSFGDFMSGMQGGMQAMDEFKNSRQRRKLYDRAITESDATFDAMDFDREKQGLPKLKRTVGSDTLIGKLSDKLDPVLSRWMEKLGRGTGTTESPTAAALPTSEEMTPLTSLEGEEFAIPELDPSQFEAPTFEFADGTAGGLGDWLDDEKAGKPKREAYNADSKEEIARRAERARATTAAPREAIPTQVVDRSAEKTVGQRVAGAAKEHAKYKGVGLNLTAPEGAGMVRRGATKLARGAGRLVAPLYIAGIGAGGIRGALDAPQPGDSILGDTWERAKGAGKGIVSGLLDPIGALKGDSGEEEVPAEAPQEAVPTAPGQATGPRSRRYPGQGAARRAASPAAGPAQAVPTVPTAEADPLSGFDVTKFQASEIPNFSNNDWVAHRKDMMDSLIMHGMSYAEAWDKVDQQVVATQQRGFMHFGNQARQLLAAGDKRAAGAAVRAAFQYLPTTTDIQVGEYNGHLVAFGVDEDTGEQVGQPMVITPEFLDSVLMNFSDRKAWAEHAQDNRKLDQADRELDQGDKRLGIMERANEIDAFNAETNAIRFGPGGGSGEGGMKLSDADRHTQYWQDQAFAALNSAGIKDPDLQMAMTAVMSSLYTEDGGATRPEVIARQVAALANTEEGRAKILAAASQLAGG